MHGSPQPLSVDAGPGDDTAAATATGRVYDRAGFGRPLDRGMRPVVLVVDFSYGFTDPGYPTGSDMSGAVQATVRLLATARPRGIPVIFTTIAYDGAQAATLTWLRKATGMAALRLGSRLVEIDHRLAPRSDEHVVVKTGASAFFGTALASHLAALRADTLVVTGATTSGCVRATVVDAVQHGYPTLVPRDCVADRAAAPHEASLFDIDQKYGDVVGSEDVLAYLAGLPGTDAAPGTVPPAAGAPAARQSLTLSSAEARA